MKFSTPVLALLASWACAVSGVRVPNADTPLFYFVSTSTSASPNLLPLRINGGTSNSAALTGAGPIGQFYFFQGQLVARDPASGIVYTPYVAAAPAGACTTFGPLTFVQGRSTSDKCALWDSFQIQSDTENSQLGAKLVFNFAGGFYSCGSTQDIWYKLSPNDGPSGCASLELYTVPVEPVA